MGHGASRRQLPQCSSPLPAWLGCFPHCQITRLPHRQVTRLPHIILWACQCRMQTAIAITIVFTVFLSLTMLALGTGRAIIAYQADRTGEEGGLGLAAAQQLEHVGCASVGNACHCQIQAAVSCWQALNCRTPCGRMPYARCPQHTPACMRMGGCRRRNTHGRAAAVMDVALCDLHLCLVGPHHLVHRHAGGRAAVEFSRLGHHILCQGAQAGHVCGQARGRKGSSRAVIATLCNSQTSRSSPTAE